MQPSTSDSRADLGDRTLCYDDPASMRLRNVRWLVARLEAVDLGENLALARPARQSACTSRTDVHTKQFVL